MTGRSNSKHREGSGFAIGVALGATFGTIFDSLALCLSLGLLLGYAIERHNSKQRQKE